MSFTSSLATLEENLPLRFASETASIETRVLVVGSTILREG